MLEVIRYKKNYVYVFLFLSKPKEEGTEVVFNSFKYGRTFNLVQVKVMVCDQIKPSKAFNILIFNTGGQINIIIGSYRLNKIQMTL